MLAQSSNPTSGNRAGDSDAIADAIRPIVYLALAPTFTWVSLYAIVALRRIPVGGVELGPTDSSFLISLLLLGVLAGAAVRLADRRGGGTRVSGDQRQPR